jgi:hypothetical protein
LLVFYLIVGSRKSYFPTLQQSLWSVINLIFGFSCGFVIYSIPTQSFWFSTPYSVDVNPNLWLFPPEYGVYPVFGSCASYLFSPNSGNLCGSIWLLVYFLLLWCYPKQSLFPVVSCIPSGVCGLLPRIR